MHYRPPLITLARQAHLWPSSSDPSRLGGPRLSQRWGNKASFPSKAGCSMEDGQKGEWTLASALAPTAGICIAGGAGRGEPMSWRLSPYSLVLPGSKHPRPVPSLAPPPLSHDGMVGAKRPSPNILTGICPVDVGASPWEDGFLPTQPGSEYPSSAPLTSPASELWREWGAGAITTWCSWAAWWAPHYPGWGEGGRAAGLGAGGHPFLFLKDKCSGYLDFVF